MKYYGVLELTATTKTSTDKYALLRPDEYAV